ncbi:hypothetical protein EAV90_37505 [Bradyrhizobium vignae]|nr:hypothetical protein EAV90_37505 [Bradyrhizobium vignae]
MCTLSSRRFCPMNNMVKGIDARGPSFPTRPARCATAALTLRRSVCRSAQSYFGTEISWRGSRTVEIVRQAVAAMSAIEFSAKEIGKIIGVIDDIASETNLLALNAGDQERSCESQ